MARSSQMHTSLSASVRSGSLSSRAPIDHTCCLFLGPRACIGRKFSTVEAVCFLTMILRDWSIEPMLEKGETLDQWKERVLQATLRFTLGIRQVPVRFRRRARG